MAVTIKNRRYQTTVTVDNKLGAALVKHGTHEYAVPPQAAAPAPTPSPSRSPASATAATAKPADPSATTTVERNTKPKAKVGGKKKGATSGKRSYNRRDMQAKD